MKLISFSMTLILIFFSFFGFAEYRVFMLQLSEDTGKVIRSFPSTLDPLQYPGYYPLPTGTRLLYTDTWMCPGNTSDFKPLCPSHQSLKPVPVTSPPPN